MKIRTNFSTLECVMTPLLTLILWGVALFSVLLAGWLWIDVDHMRESKIELTEHLAKLDAGRAASHPENTLKYEDFVALKSRVSTVTTLLHGEINSFSSLLNRIELLLPDEAYLISLQFRKNKNVGEIQVTVEASHTNILSGFMHNLEKEKIFSEVLLIRQSQRVSRDAKSIRFDLSLKERVL